MLSSNLTKILKKSFIFIGLLTTCLFAANAQAVIPQEGKTYFTKYNLKFEKGRHVTTNYWRGDLLPINSKVEVISMSGKRLIINWKGNQITILNVAKHSKKSIEEIADKLLSNKPVGLGKRYRKDIKFGVLRLGMTKKQVIKTRGYPPAHKTYSTEADRWTYWSSKFVQRSLLFENGRLVRGRGLR